MRILTSTIAAAFLSTSVIGSAFAIQNTIKMPPDPEFVREKIERLYRLEQAFLACDHVRLTGRDLKKLDEAISEVEFSSGLTAAELEGIYAQVETAASDTQAKFCSDMSDVPGEIRAIRASELRHTIR
jgi:hypothetical protein